MSDTVVADAAPPAANRYVPLVVFAAIVALVTPVVFEEGLWLTVLTQAVIYSIASLGVGLLYGRLGMVSLANYALFGVGGWVALRLSFLDTIPVVVCILAGGVFAALIGTIVGLPALRVRGLYLALITLMAAGAFYVVINAIGFPDGGSGFDGRGGVYNRRQMPQPSFADTDVAYFRFAVVMAALSFALVIFHLRGKPGRAWAMVRRSQAAAFSSGVNITRYKTWAFALAGFLSGVAGGLSASFTGQLNTLDFRASASMLLFALAVSAGSYHLLGAVIAGVLAKVLPTLFTEWGISGDVANIIFGVLLMISLTSAPEGAAGALIGLWHAIVGKFRRSPTGAPPVAAVAAVVDVADVAEVGP
jgi:branched-chain amino acid transport system permease protein